MIAYFDAEYNMPPDSNAEDRIFLREVIEIGIVICQNKKTDKEAIRYKTYVKPERFPEIHPRIESLTGISQETIDKKGIPFKEAFENVFSLIRAFDVTEIFVYGPDRDVLIADFEAYEDIFPENAWKEFTDKIHDVSYWISKKLRPDGHVGLYNMAFVYDIDAEVSHDALADAVVLKQVMSRFASGKEPNAEKKEKFLMWDKERIFYRQVVNAIKNGIDCDKIMKLVKEGGAGRFEATPTINEWMEFSEKFGNSDSE